MKYQIKIWQALIALAVVCIVTSSLTAAWVSTSFVDEHHPPPQNVNWTPALDTATDSKDVCQFHGGPYTWRVRTDAGWLVYAYRNGGLAMEHVTGGWGWKLCEPEVEP